MTGWFEELLQGIKGSTKVILSHKIELDTTYKQMAYFVHCCGVARFVWNHGLATWNERYAAGDKPNGMLLKREFNKTKYELFPWMAQVHRDCHSQPFANLQKAFVAFFKGIAKHPTKKKKGKCKDSFYVANDKFRVDNKTVTLPKIGKVRLTEALRFNGKITGAVVSRKANRWFIKTTTKLASENQAIYFEDLTVKNMVKNKKLSRAISDAGWREIRRQTEYKAAIYGGVFGVVGRWFPSSKTCRKCGQIKKELKLSHRLFLCAGCGHEEDRDLNAAHNICTAGLAGTYACGPGSSDLLRKKKVKLYRVEAGTLPCPLVDAF